MSQIIKPIRVLILDHHTMVREGLRLLLERSERIQVVGEAGTSEEALSLVNEQRPDIILLELNLDGELNTEIISQLIAAAERARLLVVTGIDEERIHQLAVQLGAMGIIRKTQPSKVLIKAVEKVNAGEVWIDRSMMANVLTQLSHIRTYGEDDGETQKIESLSGRELEVVALIGEGLKNKEIARRLTISETTVRHHLTSVYRKLDVSDRLELAIYAYRNSLADPPH